MKEVKEMSLNVVIVEDNPLTVRSLVETIDWQSLGCEVVGTAFDGESGKKLIMEMQPDILLTDIRMPQSNGLDMIEAVREHVPDCKVIIITGYEEFQYANKAIKLSVFDYLLKPVDNEEVMRSVANAVSATRKNRERDSELKQAQLMRCRAQLLSLLTNPSQRGQGIAAIFEEMGIQFQAYYIMTLQKTSESVFTQAELNHLDHLLSVYNRSMTFLLYDTAVAFVMLDSVHADWKQGCDHAVQAIREAVAAPVRIGVSELNRSLHAISKTYRQSRQALWSAAMDNQVDGTVYYREDRGHMCFEGGSDVSRRVDALIERSDLSEAFALEAAEELYALSGRQFSRLRAMVALYAMALRTRHCIPFAPKVDAAMDDVWMVTSLEDTRRSLINLSEALRAQQQPCYSLLTRNALQYISLHASEGLQLSDVAEKMCVSSSYLSAHIRKETGITFHEHVTEAKMAVARTMLDDPRVLVEEVAYAVGYNNYISFYNAFKRTQHMTPTEYRNKVAAL